MKGIRLRRAAVALAITLSCVGAPPIQHVPAAPVATPPTQQMPAAPVATPPTQNMPAAAEATGIGAIQGPGPAGSGPGRCASYAPLRRALFGDLHVHTALSFDAASLGVRNLPADAYRFARGAEVGLQPYDAAGIAARRVRLERPLDFAAVTDHAELLGELHLCHTPGSIGYDSAVCSMQRRWPLLAYIFVSSRMLNTAAPARYTFCGENGDKCRSAASGPWQMIRDAAEGAYDRTDACSFTSFVAYEWSGGPGGSMTHRNVIFADEKAPELPVSFIDEPSGERLWKRLEKECESIGCRFLTIPHNTNLSNGLLFDVPDGDDDDARRRREYEPLLEILQHKGDSECRAGAEDELCSFEKLPFSKMEEQPFPFQWKQPAKLSFAREILGEGLRREKKDGRNPYRLGMISATDTHLGTPGLVSEKAYPGHGAGGDTSGVAVSLVPDSLVFNPGGLAAVWAEENSRESIFAALGRREVYATSGPRMSVRFFGGFSYPDDLCRSLQYARDAYDGGVPMGGELAHPLMASDEERARKPVFSVFALQDAGTDDGRGAPLDRIQMVKIWLDGGEVREKVVDVASSNASDDLDLATCATPKNGSASLCTVWRDDDYDPAAPALYYARVVERPTCRWTGHLCAEAKVDCSKPDTVPAALVFCCDAAVPKTVRERAVTSPIWVAASK